MTELLLLVGSGIAALAGALWLYYKGRRAERVEREADRVKAMRTRKEVDDEVQRLDGDTLDERFARWMRNRSG